ncbi:MAG: hypothetical protein GXP28_03700 [Planctomycetes bacterium]|nr:hypothetical protein [Planctomycetota bacterium]
MPSIDYSPRTLVMLLALATAWFATDSGSLLAEEPALRLFGPTHDSPPVSPTRISTAWVSDRADSPTSAEELALPSPVKLPQPPRCFVAAPMASLTVDASLPAGLLPQDVATPYTATPKGDKRQYGHWSPTDPHWSATCQHHRPLYFEEANAERYGYTPSYCLQPLISAGHFFLTVPALPYKMAVDCPRDCVYTLGHSRPGSCGPWRWQGLLAP